MSYQDFLSSPTQKQWQQIGLQRRAGVATPLFSIYSSQSIGMGEFPDLKLLADWCEKTGLSMIQLLPMNDVGFHFRPYDAQSSFALEPAYLSLDDLEGVDTESFQGLIHHLRQKFPPGQKKVHYQVKAAKLMLLWEVFQSYEPSADYEAFIKNNQYWLEGYALFKVIKYLCQEAGWEDWTDELKNRDRKVLAAIQQDHARAIDFQKWLQWQAFEQFTKVKEYLAEKKILLMGDLPFLVSRDSADVWTHQNYFKLDLSSGAPPDVYFAKGQRWGMPPYDWKAIEAHGHDYLVQKLKSAEQYYDLFRMDHFVGLFRLWTIPTSEPLENAGLNGFFDPQDENDWEAHGRRLMEILSQNTKMLPCAEDLGMIPGCSWQALQDFAVPGMDVQRWMKEWEHTADFKGPKDYRAHSISLISNHDMCSLAGWWEFEAGTVDEALFKRRCNEREICFDSIKAKLFDLEKSFHGRLRWREDVISDDRLAEVLNRPKQQIQLMVEMYRGTYQEKNKFWKSLGLPGEFKEHVTPELVQASFEAISKAESIFSIQFLQDWFLFMGIFPEDNWTYRINFPGTMGDNNWSLILPLSLEEMLKMDENCTIRELNEKSERMSLRAP